MQTSAKQVSFLRRVAPRYLKLVTSANFWQFILISALMLFVLLIMTLFFSVLTSIPYAVALLVRSWSSPLLPSMRSMSSANRKLHMGLPPMEMDVWLSWSVFCMIFSRNKWTGWVRVSIREGHLLLSWETPLADFLTVLHFRSSHVNSALMAWTSPFSMLKSSLRLWTRGIDRAGVVCASL